MSDAWLVVALASGFGLLIGSFLNVCIYRWPRDLSIVRPRSQCTECEAPIAWFDNIPVLSYAVLGGRCRRCKRGISLRYPLVELLTAAFFGWCFYRYGATAEAARWCIFCAILITLGFADAETRVLPDEFTLGGLAAGLLFALAAPGTDVPIADALLGAVIPSGFLWLGGFVFEKIRHKEGLGFGDVKMTAMIGSFLGLKGALLTLLTGSLLGSIIGLAYIAIARKDAGSYELPLGTFLSVGGLLFTLIGPALVAWSGSL